MMPGTTDAPFGTDVVETIALEAPPLASVLVQIRFDPVLRVADEAFVGFFQQAIRDRYPTTRADTEFQVNLPTAPDVPPTHVQTRLWRFTSEDEIWQVTLSSSFVALETKTYAGHADFLERLNEVLVAVGEHIQPQRVLRAGVRYLQRLEGDDLGRLSDFLRDEILGICGVDAGIDTCLTQARHLAEEVTLHARWGTLPPGVGTDLLPPLEAPNWIFDIDVFDETARDFDAEQLTAVVFDYSRRQYRFFRWAVTPAFLERFGANNEQLAALRERLEA
jgi:uncharacterized protein (TIGR04255 family)